MTIYESRGLWGDVLTTVFDRAGETSFIRHGNRYHSLARCVLASVDFDTLKLNVHNRWMT